jgi:hypothetical protein
VEHVVFFPAPDGNPAFRRLPSLDDAVRFVEHLRNADGVTEVSVHALTAVPLAVRTVYRVEVVSGDAAETPAPAASAAPAPEAAAIPEQPAPAVEPVAPVEVAPVEVPAATAEASVAPESAVAVAEPAAEAPAESADEASVEDQAPEAGADEAAVGAGNGSGEVHSLGFFAS